MATSKPSLLRRVWLWAVSLFSTTHTKKYDERERPNRRPPTETELRDRRQRMERELRELIPREHSRYMQSNERSIIASAIDGKPFDKIVVGGLDEGLRLYGSDELLIIVHHAYLEGSRAVAGTAGIPARSAYHIVKDLTGLTDDELWHQILGPVRHYIATKQLGMWVSSADQIPA